MLNLKLAKMKTSNKPQFRLYAEAPTVYQSNSVRFFGLTNQGRNGLLTYDYFDTKEDAIARLHQIVDFYAATNGTEEEINEMHEDADNGYLSYDAVTCHLQEAEYHSDDIDDVTWR